MDKSGILGPNKGRYGKIRAIKGKYAQIRVIKPKYSQINATALGNAQKTYWINKYRLIVENIGKYGQKWYFGVK